VELATRAVGAQFFPEPLKSDRGFSGLNRFSGFNGFKRDAFHELAPCAPFGFETDAVDAEFFEELEMCL
jgi:hypothetical protein